MNEDRPKPIDSLIEMAASAYRECDATGRVLPSSAWHDLPPEDRAQLFEVQTESRLMERALDPDGLSGTGRAVMARIRNLGQLR